jgi:hypothetical protein
VARILRIGLDLFANAADVDIHRTWCDMSCIAPDGMEQLAASKDAADMVGEIIEQPELSGGVVTRMPRTVRVMAPGSISMFQILTGVWDRSGRSTRVVFDQKDAGFHGDIVVAN